MWIVCIIGGTVRLETTENLRGSEEINVITSHLRLQKEYASWGSHEDYFPSEGFNATQVRVNRQSDYTLDV